MRGGKTLEDAKMLNSRWWALENPNIGLQCHIPKQIFLPQFKTCWFFLFCLLARKALEDKLDDTAAISDERAQAKKGRTRTD